MTARDVLALWCQYFMDHYQMKHDRHIQQNGADYYICYSNGEVELVSVSAYWSTRNLEYIVGL